MLAQMAILALAVSLGPDALIMERQAGMISSMAIAHSGTSSIKKGMSYESVVAAIGAPSHCQENTQLIQGDRIRSRTCTWYLSNGSSTIVLFRDVYTWGRYELQVVGIY